jgi:hypothetical protein
MLFTTECCGTLENGSSPLNNRLGIIPQSLLARPVDVLGERDGNFNENVRLYKGNKLAKFRDLTSMSSSLNHAFNRGFAAHLQRVLSIMLTM